MFLLPHRRHVLGITLCMFYTGHLSNLTQDTLQTALQVKTTWTCQNNTCLTPLSLYNVLIGIGELRIYSGEVGENNTSLNLGTKEPEYTDVSNPLSSNTYMVHNCLILWHRLI